MLDGDHDTVWATEQQIMELFGKARRTIGEHIKNIYEEGELDKESTWREFGQVQKEGEREVSRKVSIYNLDVIISVGYRVKSQVGTEFRKWATQRLKEYLLKGYSINQKLLQTERQKVETLQREINQLNEELFQTQQTLTDGLLSIISRYSKSFELLDKCLPVSIWTTSASHHEVKLVEESLDWMMVNQPKMLIGDRAYDSNDLRAKMNQKSVELIVPYRRNRKYNITQDRRKLRRYRKRCKVERFFAWLHNYRRCVVRYDHYNINFEGFVLLATLAIYLKKYF